MEHWGSDLFSGLCACVLAWHDWCILSWQLKANYSGHHKPLKAFLSNVIHYSSLFPVRCTASCSFVFHHVIPQVWVLMTLSIGPSWASHLSLVQMSCCSTKQEGCASQSSRWITFSFSDLLSSFNTKHHYCGPSNPVLLASLNGP